MLNTNQSNRKNIWKFGIILPFVTAFMLLFQVETIAQEKQSKTIKKEIKKSKIEIEKAKPVIEKAKKEIVIDKKEIEQAKPEIENARKEIELEKKDNSLISQTDVQPEPQNGLQEFRKQIAMKFKLPEVKSDVNASIVVKFLVLKTGEISTITILKEDPKNLGLGDELTRILKESPNWKPGTKDGKPADLYFVLPVAIQIQSTK